MSEQSVFIEDSKISNAEVPLEIGSLYELRFNMRLELLGCDGWFSVIKNVLGKPGCSKY
jgi:hypothetical protein